MMRPSSLLLPLLLAACASDGGTYPSLAPRPAEKLTFDEPTQPAPLPVRPDPALDRRIAAAQASLAKARSAFVTAADRAEGLATAARGASVGSDRWVAAQTALGALDTLRADTTQIVTDLDDAASQRAAKLLPAYPGLDAARSAAGAEAEAQATRIDALSARLPAA